MDRPLGIVEQAQIVSIKRKAEELAELLRAEEQNVSIGPGAPLDATRIARERLAECVFWAVHAITK